MFVSLLLLTLACSATDAYYTLKQLSYTKLPASTKNDFRLFSGTAQEGAFDYKQSILYVVGQTSHLLHVIDIQDPTNPVLLFSHAFTVGEGTPRSVAFCSQPNTATGDVAVALSSVYPTAEGHVLFFRPYQRSVGGSDLALDGYIPVGPYPDHIKYTPDCGSLVVANKGKPGKDYAGKYFDPPATISIVHGEQTGNPSVQHVDFNNYTNRVDIRSPAKFIPLRTLPTPTSLVQDLEPECIVVSADSKTAYVTLQTNDAIATINITSGLVTALNPLPRKSWDGVPIDASDMDGGVHRRTYTNLKGIRQPSVIKVLSVGQNNYLFTADEGHTRVYTSAAHTFVWTDDSLARTQVSKIDTFSTDQAFRTNVGTDEYLGRLHVSSIDGKNLLSQDQKYQHLETFGGRGFSIWDASDLSSPVYDSLGSIEEYMETWQKDVFNSDCIGSTTARSKSPENLRDSVSDNMGPKINALDVAEDNGTTLMVVGSETTGILFIYTIDTSSGTPVPQFQSVVRSGMKDYPWQDLYDNGTSGDGYISDIGIITSDKSPIDQPLLYVISDGTGSVSLYQIVDQHPTIPVGKR